MHSCMLSLWGGWRRCFCLSRLLTNGPVHSTAAGQHLCLQLVHLPRVFLQCLQLLGQMCLAHDKAPASSRHPCRQDEKPKECYGLCRPLISSSLPPPSFPTACPGKFSKSYGGSLISCLMSWYKSNPCNKSTYIWIYIIPVVLLL